MVNRSRGDSQYLQAMVLKELAAFQSELYKQEAGENFKRSHLHQATAKPIEGITYYRYRHERTTTSPSPK
jgi:hypothetical protein